MLYIQRAVRVTTIMKTVCSPGFATKMATCSSTIPMTLIGSSTRLSEMAKQFITATIYRKTKGTPNGSL